MFSYTVKLESLGIICSRVRRGFAASELVFQGMTNKSRI